MFSLIKQSLLAFTIQTTYPMLVPEDTIRGCIERSKSSGKQSGPTLIKRWGQNQF